MSAQVVIDSKEFARHGRTAEGDIAVADLSRLKDSLLSNGGSIHYTLKGSVGENGRLFLHCTVSGMVTLQCQRCLEPMAFSLDIASDLELAAGGDILPGAEDETEAVDIIPADRELDVSALVEDEILLNLPMSPMHEESACPAGQRLAQQGKERQSAFGALAALKATNMKSKGV